MQLATTFRGLSRRERALASRVLERSTQPMGRLLEAPATIRAVIEESGPERRVLLTLGGSTDAVTSESVGRDVAAAVATACERLRAQLIRRRQRRDSQRLRTIHRV